MIMQHICKKMALWRT